MTNFYGTVAAVIPLLILALVVEADFGQLVADESLGLDQRKTWVTRRPRRVRFLVRCIRLMLILGLFVEVSCLIAVAFVASDETTSWWIDRLLVVLSLFYVAGLLAFTLMALESRLAKQIDRALRALDS